MDKLARREPVMRGRYFYEPRGIRPKPARLHVSHVSLAEIQREREREREREGEYIDKTR